jgi:hypothetical protein
LETNKPGSPQGSDIISTDPDVTSINVDNMPFVRGFPKKGNFLDWLDYSIQMFETGQVLTDAIQNTLPEEQSEPNPEEVITVRVFVTKSNGSGYTVEQKVARKDSAQTVLKLKRIHK